jgi:ubiquinone/menaquinone biosynthesis C-methylase UbiE
MANEEFIATWNEILVPKFTRFRRVFVVGAKAHSDRAFARHPPPKGARVLDVGCGFGENTLDLARLVGDGGSAVGFDCCEPFLDAGRKDAAAAGLGNVTFVNGDAQSHTFDAPFDYVFSRFGTMFFASPKAALKNLRRALVPGGKVVSLVWRTIDDNPWLGVPKKVAQKHLPPPPEDGQTCGPGPFSMANPDTVRAIYEGAGFTNVELDRNDSEVEVGHDVDESIAFQLALGPAGEIVREAGELGEKKRDVVVADLRDALRPFLTPRGIMMGSSSWTITATNPGS